MGVRVRQNHTPPNGERDEHLYLHETFKKRTSRLSRLKLLTHLQLISIKNKIETLQSGTWLLLDDGDGKKKNDIRKKVKRNHKRQQQRKWQEVVHQKKWQYSKYSKCIAITHYRMQHILQRRWSSLQKLYSMIRVCLCIIYIFFAVHRTSIRV